MGYQCMQGDDQAPVLLAMNLDTGETEAVCAEHLATFFLSGLVSVTAQEWAPTGQAYADPESGEATDEDEAADGQPPAIDLEPGPVPAPEPEPEPAPSEDGDEHDQLAEDGAVRDAELRAELAGRGRS